LKYKFVAISIVIFRVLRNSNLDDFHHLNVNLVSHANQQFILSGLFIGPNLRGVCLMYGELFQ